MFTTEDIAEALKFLDTQKLSSITNNLAYRWAVMIPKGAGQVGKTVLGPFTHGRNFTSGGVTTVSTGNISLLFTNPGVIGQAIFPKGWNLTGVDINPRAISYAKFNASLNNGSILFSLNQE